LSVAAVLAVALSDWPLTTLSGFWSAHAMLTNLVSSAVFAGFSIAVIERWLHAQEQRQAEALRRGEQQRLSGVGVGGVGVQSHHSVRAARDQCGPPGR